MSLFSFLLPFAIDLIRGYIRSTDSKKDDLVLDIVKDSVCYLEKKDNNTVNSLDSASISSKTMK